jgi:hypothetical protein
MIFVFFLLFIKCERQASGPVQEEMSGKISMIMNLSGAPSEVSDIRGYLGRVSFDTIFFNFIIMNNSASALVENIMHGPWKLTVNAFDSTGIVLYTGSKDVTVIAGTITPVSLHLNPATGTLEITVTWGTLNTLDSLLIAYYPFNGNADDESGNGNHGTVYGAVLTQDRWGNPDKAYYFDGVNDYIDVGNDPTLKPQLPLTFSCWFIYEPLYSRSPFFTNNDGAANYFGFWSDVDHTGRIQISYGNSGPIHPTGRGTKRTNLLTQPQTWYHIVGIIRDAQDMDIYINGVNESGFYDGIGGSIAYNSSPGFIGRHDSRVYLPEDYFHGTLDEIRLYGRELSYEEIQALYTEF